MDYGILATFTSNQAYLDVMTNLLKVATGGQAVPNSNNNAIGANIPDKLLWLGAKATADGSHLSDYCWMIDTKTESSQVSSSADSVLLGNPSAALPYCLAVNISQPSVFYGYKCGNGNNQFYTLCEFGKLIFVTFSL